MRRLLVHPTLRILLIAAFAIAVLVATEKQSQHQHGLVTGWAADVTGIGQVWATHRIWSQGIDFYINPDGSITPYLNYYGLDPIDTFPDRGTPLASAKFDYPGQKNYGLFFTPFTRYPSTGYVVWHAAELEHGYTEDDLTESVQLFYDIHSGVDLSDTEMDRAFNSDLFYVAAIRNGYPLTHSVTKFSVDIPTLFIELAYYTLFIWWIITLIYARKLWPKPDGSRCPICNYETVGLTTPTCPECGNDLPPSPRRGAHKM